MKIRKKQLKATLFNSSQIATKIERELDRDFKTFTQMYKGNDHIMRNAFSRQRLELLKKFSPPRLSPDDLETKTFDKFLSVNDHMLNFNIKNSLESIPEGPCFKRYSDVTQVQMRAKSLISYVLGNFDEDEFFLECRNSSGTSIGVPFRDTAIDRKFRFPMSTTESVKPLFQRYLDFDFKLKSTIHEMNGDLALSQVYDVVKGSRATTVEKTSTSRRMICIEPTCNMFLQQGLMRVMYKRLDAIGLDVATLPDRHKRLARESSITSLNATIDFSSASDCVSIELLRKLLPPLWFSIIYQLRCTSTSIQGEEVQLQMISSMGNAVTFPLETLVFWAFAVAAVVTENTDSPSRIPCWNSFKMASVFGDDCILPTENAELFMRAMSSVGFIVNTDKSYFGEDEQFRESCGGDYLQGYDNRPYFLKAPVNERKSCLEPWLYIIMNSILKKYFIYFGSTSYLYDKHVLRYLFSLFGTYNLSLKIVPSYFPDDSGLKMSSDIERLLSCYPVAVSQIARSHHGSMHFSYLRFMYKEKRKIHEGISYAVKLKKFVASDMKPFKDAPDRRNGGYVVAKGLSAHWAFPRGLYKQ